MNDLAAGALIAGYLAGVLFVLRRSSSRDRFFGLLAAALVLLVIQRIAPTPFHVMRLAAYVLVLVAIDEKKQRPRWRS